MALINIINAAYTVVHCKMEVNFEELELYKTMGYRHNCIPLDRIYHVGGFNPLIQECPLRLFGLWFSEYNAISIYIKNYTPQYVYRTIDNYKYSISLLFKNLKH